MASQFRISAHALLRFEQRVLLSDPKLVYDYRAFRANRHPWIARMVSRLRQAHAIKRAGDKWCERAWIGAHDGSVKLALCVSFEAFDRIMWFIVNDDCTAVKTVITDDMFNTLKLADKLKPRNRSALS